MVFADEEDGRRYEVTITNVTRGQVITPPVLFTHNADFKLFQVGSPASDELALMAEEGDTSDLVALLTASEAVYDSVTASAPIFPSLLQAAGSHSVTLEIMTKGEFKYLSVAGMLASTNDGFFCGQRREAPQERKNGHRGGCL